MRQTDEHKYRNEIKYVCTEQELRLLEYRIRAICPHDIHAGDNGIYVVRSVYFDDYNDSCYHENESGVNFREKFRIRIYNEDISKPVLECKRKVNGKNHKLSCPLTTQQCRDILNGDFVLPEEADPLLQKFFAAYRTRMLRSKVIVQYERTPFTYSMGNVRITFDRNISGTSDVNAFLEKDIALRPVMPAGQHVLEIKYDEFLPDYIKAALEIRNLRQTAYSKYCICRRMC